MPISLYDNTLSRVRQNRGSGHITDPNELEVGQVVRFYMVQKGQQRPHTVRIAEIIQRSKELRFAQLRGWYTFEKLALLPYPDGRWNKHHWLERIKNPDD